MDIKVIFIDSLRVEPSIDKIYQSLKYSEETKITQKQKDEINGYINEAKDIIQLKGAVRSLTIESINNDTISFKTEELIKSKNLSHFLTECSQAVLLAATAGQKIGEEIEQSDISNNLVRAAVLDAAASEMVDGALNWIVDFFNHRISREGKKLLKSRFSAGYGDFDLSYQKFVFQALELNKIDVSLTADYILIPEKTVTAVSGVLK